MIDCRNIISTTHTSTTTSTSGRTLKVTYDNSKSKVAFDNTYKFQETISRSMSASASVGANILGIEVGASLGGSSSYSREESFSYSVKIPAGKIGRVYASEKTEIAKFRHIIQPQQKSLSDPWKNSGGMKVEISTVITKSPVYSLETN